MSLKSVREDAERFVHEYGQATYDKARDAMRAAHRHQNARLEDYLATVAREIARRTNRKGDAKLHRRNLQH